MDLALNNQQRLICHNTQTETQTNKQTNKQIIWFLASLPK